MVLPCWIWYSPLPRMNASGTTTNTWTPNELIPLPDETCMKNGRKGKKNLVNGILGVAFILFPKTERDI